jgi:hypothetical protein
MTMTIEVRLGRRSPRGVTMRRTIALMGMMKIREGDEANGMVIRESTTYLDSAAASLSDSCLSDAASCC